MADFLKMNLPGFRVSRLLAGAALPAVMLTGTASADLLVPGALVDDFATSFDSRPELLGELEAETFIPYSLTDDRGSVFYVGQIIHDVVRNPDDQTLSFYYRIENSPSSAVLGIENLIAYEFDGYQTDVAILTDLAGDVAPIEAVRSDDGSEVVFGFDASSRIEPNSRSYTFLVKTNATSFDDRGLASISAFVAESAETGSQPVAGGEAAITTFRPTGDPLLGVINPPAPPPTPPPPVAVPLPPAALAALPTMLGGLMYMRRLRRQANA